MILKTPALSSEGVMISDGYISDGYLYRNNPYFKILIAILYHDELVVSSPLGSNALTHKVDMFYYTVGNVNPKFRSKICAIKD